jgi:hypothetical protein
MMEDDNGKDQPEVRWFIDPNWYPERGRSISALLQGCLCIDCHKQLAREEKEAHESELRRRIKECDSHSSQFITAQMPILESIFRFFIASDNEPMTAGELGRQLSERRGGDISRTSEEILLRLLKNDRYYGFRPTPD